MGYPPQPSLVDDLFANAANGSLTAQIALRDHVHRVLSTTDRARQELVEFLREAGARDWLTLDRSIRAYGYWEPRSPRAQAKTWIRRALDSVLPAGHRRDVLDAGIESMSRDGHARESAVRTLAFERDPLAGPFLVLRSTDWVDEVAAVAVSIALDRIQTDIAFLVASAGIVFALEGRQRTSGLVDVVLDRAAADPSIRAALLGGVDRRTRRRVIGHQPVRDAMPVGELVALAVSDADTSVATAAGVAAVGRLAGTDDDTAINQLLKGPALVRRSVLEALPPDIGTHDAAARHLFDRSPVVRAAAQAAYDRAGGDASAVYRAALRRAEHVPVAIVELGVIGNSQDRDMIVGALQAPEAASRAAAVKAIRWLTDGPLAELLMPMLWDSAPGVTRAAERRLRPFASSLDNPLLLDLAAASGSHNRRAAYRLLRRRTAAERIEADLIALADADATNQQVALQDLRSWLRRGAASAPRGDLATRRRLNQRLAAVEPQLGPLAEAIRFHAGLRPADGLTER